MNGFMKKTVDSGVQTEAGHIFPTRNKDLKQPKITVPKVGPSQYHRNH